MDFDPEWHLREAARELVNTRGLEDFPYETVGRIVAAGHGLPVFSDGVFPGKSFRVCDDDKFLFKLSPSILVLMHAPQGLFPFPEYLLEDFPTFFFLSYECVETCNSFDLDCCFKISTSATEREDGPLLQRVSKTLNGDPGHGLGILDIGKFLNSLPVCMP